MDAKKTTALLLIDLQRGFLAQNWGPRNNPNFEQNISELLELCRRVELHVIHIQHRSTERLSPLRPDQPGGEFMDCAKLINKEKVFNKSVNSAFIGTGLEAYLKKEGLSSLLLAGFTSDHCVSTTARMAANLGFETAIVENATATFDRRGPDGVLYEADLVHKVSMASLHNEFAKIVTLDELKRSLWRPSERNQ